MALFKKLDMWSIMDGIDKIMDYEYNGNEKDSQYWDYYSEQITEMSCIAADMYNEMMGLKQHISYKMPYKKIEFCDEDECEQTAIAWFNTAACMLSDVDMKVLLENENCYDDDLIKEKEKRINALQRCTKEQQMFLYGEVLGFITRYLELVAAFETIISVINELDYHQSFIINKNGVVAPDSAYL